MLAADKLQPGALIAGRAYFISQGEPWPLWDVVNGILAAAGLPPVTRRVSPTLAHIAGWLYEGTYRALRISSEPPLTRFVASWPRPTGSTSPRRGRVFRFAPKVSMTEGLARLREWFAPGANRTGIPVSRVTASSTDSPGP